MGLALTPGVHGPRVMSIPGGHHVADPSGRPTGMEVFVDADLDVGDVLRPNNGGGEASVGEDAVASEDGDDCSSLN